MQLNDFLAEDFFRLGQPLLERCAVLEGQRLYLTGATGFFGKHLLALLALLYQRGVRFEVTALSRDPAKFLAEQPWCANQPWLNMCRGDVRHPWPARGRYTLLLHAATDTAASAHEDKEALFKGLLTSAQQMCSFCEQAGVQRLLLTGSGAQFGSISPEWSTTGVPDDAAIACDPTLPSSAYGEGKRVTELLAALHAQRTGMAVAYARCFAFVGPELALGGHFAIGNFIRDALAGQPIRLSSTGQALRSYLYGADLALWLLLLLLEAPGGTRVNVGSDASLSVLELAQQVRTVLNPALALRVNAQQPGEERQSYWPAITQARQQRLEVWTPLPLAIQRTAEWVQHCRLRR